jgi:acetolactate synthase-1/2/3 large subunit
MNGGERVADVLRAHGIPVLFTLCGGHISPILVAARARGIRVVDTRHEATAVYAADFFSPWGFDLPATESLARIHRGT